jgi:hypothetical protein
MRLLQLLSSRNRPVARATLSARKFLPRLEVLEARALPSILYSSAGSRNVVDNHGPVLTSAAVDLIFWGAGWNNASTYLTNITNAVQTIMDSPYLSGLSQYRNVSNGTLLQTDLITDTSPGSTINDSQVATFVRTNINNGQLPGPSTAGGQILYMVIVQPGTTAGSVGGAHGTTTSNAGRFHYGWSTNPTTLSLDTVTDTFSHELTEAATDPEVNFDDAFVVPITRDEICDGDAQLYSYRLNGVLVQSSLSQATHTYNIYDGNQQNFIVSSTGVLTVNGDQLANHDDTITIDTSGSQVRVTLNDEVVQLTTGSQGQVHSITVNSGTGNDTINVLHTLAAAPVTIRSSGDATINLGSGGSVQTITGAVTIAGAGPNRDILTIDDSADTGNRTVAISGTAITGLSPAALTLSGSTVDSLTILGGRGRNTYNLTGTPAHTAVTLSTGTGVDAVNVTATSVPLTIDSSSGSGADTITVGSTSNSLSGIQAVNVIATATDALTLNDQGTSAAQTFTLDGSSISRSSGPTVTYTGVGALVLNGGSGGNTFVLNGSSATAALTLDGGTGANTLVGSSAGNRWEVTGANAGLLSGAAYGTTVAFADIQNLTAGGGGDYFLFDDGAAVAASVTGGGSDTLDYTPYTTSVVVDLQTGTATGVGGLVSGIGTVTGGSGTPAGSGVYNLLIGSGGNTLNGGFGRSNILVAGASASTLNAGDGQDLLIGGSTAYDSDPALAAWLQIAAYWAGTDDYSTRVANLTSGNGVPLLDATVVSGNGGGNALNGNGSLALLYTDGLDSINGFDPGSQQVTVNP